MHHTHTTRMHKHASHTYKYVSYTPIHMYKHMHAHHAHTCTNTHHTRTRMRHTWHFTLMHMHHTNTPSTHTHTCIHRVISFLFQTQRKQRGRNAVHGDCRRVNLSPRSLPHWWGWHASWGHSCTCVWLCFLPHRLGLLDKRNPIQFLHLGTPEWTPRRTDRGHTGSNKG